jgi:hypothetical protein
LNGCLGAGLVMNSLWEFILQKRNREVLGWLGGGLVVAATGLWAAIVYLLPPQKSSEPRPANVQADCGGVAIGGSVTGTTINGAVTNSDCTPRSKSGVTP